MKPGQLISTYTFWEVATLWAADLQHSRTLIAKALINGVIRDGLRFQSIAAKKFDSSQPLRGDPYVGYCAMSWLKPVILRADVLEHFLHVTRTGATPSRKLVAREYVEKSDFRNWILATEQRLPPFWFALNERD